MCTFPTMVSHHSVTFTDEYAIYLSAKSWNAYMWAKQIPHSSNKWHCQHPHIMMLAGLTIDLIIAPYFFMFLWLVKSYLVMWLIPQLDNVGLLNSVILSQDGAPAHYAADMCVFLNCFHLRLDKLDLSAGSLKHLSN
jgi:hypothetical protein